MGQARGDDASKGQVANLAEEAPAPIHAEEAGTAEVVPPEREPEAARQEGVEAAGEGGSLTEARPHPSQSGGGVAEPTIEPREVIPRRKAGEKAQAIIVAAPREEAEMVDIGARPKKRGRPRKNPSVDPPDPHRGSVLYPGKGVCADPVDGGAILGEGGPSPHSRDRER